MRCSTLKNIVLASFLVIPFTSGSVLHHGRGDIRDVQRRSETSKVTQVSMTQIVGTTSIASVAHDAEETSTAHLSGTSATARSHSSTVASQTTAVISIPDPVSTSDATRM